MSSTTSTGNGASNGGGGNDGRAIRWLRVCGTDDVGESGQLCGFSDGDLSVLVANKDGTIHATDLICTHADADLSTGFLGPDGIRCPLHLSVFDLVSGKPQNPPAEKPLRVYNVKIDNGHVYVGV